MFFGGFWGCVFFFFGVFWFFLIYYLFWGFKGGRGAHFYTEILNVGNQSSEEKKKNDITIVCESYVESSFDCNVQFFHY